MEKIHKKNLCIFIAVCLFVSVVPSAFSSDLFEKAQEHLRYNRTEKALSLLEQVVSLEPDNSRALLYLGIAYEQAGRYEDAVRVLKRGSNQGGELGHLFDYNLGNNLFRQGKYSISQQYYSQAVKQKSGFAPAYLNRANAYLKTDDYQKALRDYRTYLDLEQDSRQRSSIEQMIGLLESKLEEQQQRIAEQKQKEEEERQKREQLLNSVLKSLEHASEDTQNMGAGTEDIIELEEATDIED
ncbi:MAG: tetratricopeptide repeat protein [Spirochaetales bacterium]|nr:tetratricopeptide repeat protein [Spirochaetales bacterium]MCF7939076.1 tetratricopeptide repeat protein [Spirochaetales bacterium]